MAPILEGGARGSNGIAFLVAGGLVYEIIAFSCSSPQTTELNADKRAPTLMKWVHLGQALAAVTITIAAIVDPVHRTAIVVGGLFAMASSEAFYLHARAAGLQGAADGLPGTETYR